MRFFKVVLLAFLAGQLSGCDGNVAPSSIFSDHGLQGVIYGSNSIQEVPVGHPNADSSVMLVLTEKFQDYKEKNATYLVSEVYGLEGFSWSSQPSLGFCSGILVAEDMVLTAGHCVAQADICSKMQVVANYDTSRLVTAMVSVSCKEVYKVKNDIGGQGLDYALLKLEKSMGFQPLKIAQTASVVNEKIYTLGYPLGSFKKKARGKVRQIVEGKGTYVASLDAFEGNSGSPVFSEKTHELIGVVSGGEGDFVTDAKEGSVLRVKRCRNTGCTGEFITPIQKILADLEK
ncbi:MAG: trypsin-like peptidase domain-containing protein [Bdellovibrio sp.]|nr:trypsin-like peptidase domain-containing protein [Bdellovibrio sp.]